MERRDLFGNSVGNNPATTEWDDVQRKFGNLPPLEVGIEEETLENWIVEEANKKLSHESDTIEQLNEHIDDGDGSDEESELRRIRERRLAELQAKRNRERFGDCFEISKSQFISEVSDDSKKHNVLVLIYTNGDSKGEMLKHLFSQVADNCRTVKFLYMREEKKVVPMIILYSGGEPKFTLRPDVSCIREPDELEWVLAQNDMVETELQEDPRIHSRNDRIHINIHRKQRNAYPDVA